MPAFTQKSVAKASIRFRVNNAESVMNSLWCAGVAMNALGNDADKDGIEKTLSPLGAGGLTGSWC